MAKNVILQMKIDGQLQDIMTRSCCDNVIVEGDVTLATKLAEIIASIATLESGNITPEQVDTKISAAIDNLIGGAPETYDTLKEIADYLATHQNEYTALVQTLGTKVDKVEGKGLSANDFTDALLAKLNGIAEGATKVESSESNGYIKVNGTETRVYAHPTGAGNEHLPTGGEVGQVLRATGSGKGEWGANVRSGASVPADLAEGELFIKIL